MPFKRKWDSSCPRVWERWEDHGVSWTIEDLAPEDDQIAVELAVEHFLPDEALCAAVDISSNPDSVEGSRKFWHSALAQRTSLAVYRELDGARTLAAFNVCPVRCSDDSHGDEEIQGEQLRQVIGVLSYMDDKCGVFKTLKVDKYLSGAGLIVTRESRGHGLGTKLLNAREHLCASLGIPATATVFTGPASQKSAARAGFLPLLDVSWAELAAAGFTYPADERILKLMAKKYR